MSASRIARLLHISKISLTTCVCIICLIILLYRSQQGITDSSKAFNDDRSSEESQWKVLSDGTVVHNGNFLQHYDYIYLFNNVHICDSLSKADLRLLVIVESKVDHFKEREAMRETWALRLLQQSYNFRVIFVLGKADNDNRTGKAIQEKVYVEHLTYGDIIQIDFVDTLANVTLKSILSLQWFVSHCSDADYLFKTDDDLYIHVPNLLTALKAHSHCSDAILCHENKIRKIIRKDKLPYAQLFFHDINKITKYSVRHEALPGNFYPKYCAGFGYALPRGVAKLLHEAAIKTPYFFIEDVFITGFCREKAKVNIIDLPELTLRPLMTPHQGICPFRNGRINSNEFSYDKIRMLWRNVNTQGYFCPNFVGYAN